jgi:hypothetical protein
MRTAPALALAFLSICSPALGVDLIDLPGPGYWKQRERALNPEPARELVIRAVQYYKAPQRLELTLPQTEPAPMKANPFEQEIRLLPTPALKH